MSTSDVVIGGGLSLAGGVVGASLAFFNGALQRRSERAGWTRNQRAGVYVDVLALLRRVAADVPLIAMAPDKPLPIWRTNDEVDHALARLALFASTPAREAFDRFDRELATFWSEHPPAAMAQGQLQHAYDAVPSDMDEIERLEAKAHPLRFALADRAQQVVKRIKEFEVVVREDFP